MDIFSARIKWLRQKEGLTQVQVADFIGMSAPGYTKIEQGTREPNLETLTKFPILYDESLEFMLGMTDFDKQATLFLLHFKSVDERIRSLKFKINHYIKQFGDNKELLTEMVKGPSEELFVLDKEYYIALNQLVTYFKTIPMTRVTDEDEMVDYFISISESDTYTAIKSRINKDAPD